MPKKTTKAKATKKSAKKKSSKKVGGFTKDEREIKYPDYEVRACYGDEALTVEDCKNLLGWWEESENVKFGSLYLLKDVNGNKVRCINNDTNRPLYMASIDTLVQEHLRRQWRFNFEPVIIGKTGRILNGQHSLISLVLAEQHRQKDPEKWSEFWKQPVQMEKLVCYGLEEDDDVVNTMDTCKPRSLMDVVFRSEYFQDLKTGRRKIAARATDHAVRLLWHRTGASDDAFAPIRTHKESIDFIERHPKILEAVRHIIGIPKVQRIISPGYAAALLYLMAASATPDDSGYDEEAKEEHLDLSLWEDACDFWTQVPESPDFKAIRTCLIEMQEDEETAQGVGLIHRIGVCIKAWLAYVDHKKLTPASLRLEYEVDEEGWKHLTEIPTVGGIDHGEPA